MCLSKLKILLIPNTNCVIINQKTNYVVYFYNDFYFYKINHFNKNLKLFFNKNLNSLTIISWANSINSKNLNKKIEKLLFSLNFYYFSKFRLKGKGFRLYRNIDYKFVEFYLGHSHTCLIHFNGVILFRLHKYKFFILSNYKKKIENTIKLVNIVKPKNFYTKRGIGYTKQIIIKRKGKGALA